MVMVYQVYREKVVYHPPNYHFAKGGFGRLLCSKSVVPGINVIGWGFGDVPTTSQLLSLVGFMYHIMCYHL